MQPSAIEKQDRFAAMQAILDQHRDGMLAFTQAYIAIRDERLYEAAGHATFADYLQALQQRWKRSYSYKLLQGAEALSGVLAQLDDPASLQVIENAHQAHALAQVSPDLQPAVVELLQSTIVDKATAKAIQRIGKALEQVKEDLIASGAIEVSEGEQLPAAAIPAISSAVLLELRESNYRQLEHLKVAQEKREPLYERTDTAQNVLTWRTLGSVMQLTDQQVTVKIFGNAKGFTVRIERVEG